MKRFGLILAALTLLFPGVAGAQVAYPTAAGPGVKVAGTVPLQCDATGKNCAPVSAANPLVVSGAAGGATSANQTATGASAQTVQGNVASGATDAGNPVKIGGLYSSSPPVLTNGKRGDLQLTQRGFGIVAIGDASNANAAAVFYNGGGGVPITDGQGFGFTGFLGSVGIGMVFNGTGWDRQRGDASGTYVSGPSGATLGTSANQATQITAEQAIQANQTGGGQFANPFPTAASGAGVTQQASTTVTGATLFKSGAGNLYGLNLVTGGSAGFLLVFDAAGVPADGAVQPVRCLPIAANTGIELNWRGAPLRLGTGIVVVFSTTGCFTKTMSATAFMSADVK